MSEPIESWIFDVTEDLDTQRFEAETRYAEMFLRARGRPTVDEWARMTPLAALALAAAGDRLEAQRLLDEQIASGGLEGAAAVISKVDGGALHQRLLLRAAVARAAGEGVGHAS